DLQEGIFYAQLIFEQDGKIYEIDSRTSDAVAIGVRFKVPVYTYENVLSVAGIEVEDSELEDGTDPILGSVEDDDETAFEEEVVVGETDEDQVTRIKKEMDAAITDEDYEKAARLRDEIARLEGTDN
ncbi:MAG TPA: hypothetical protein ENJ82_02920, partial [Bacteroidetes bacterium]|nr:hypothetical protein [Bacteroidota bacterium]